MKTRFLYIILIAAIGITIIVNVAYANPLQGPFVASPSNNLPGRGAQYMIQFTLPTTPAGSTITSIDINFPSGYNFLHTNATIVDTLVSNTITMIPGSIVNTNTTNIRFTPNPTISASANEIITLFIAKIVNTLSSGSYNLQYVIHYSGTSNTDTGQAPFSISNTLGGLTWDTTDYNIQLAGNVSSYTANQFKITTSSNVPICIGAC